MRNLNRVKPNSNLFTFTTNGLFLEDNLNLLPLKGEVIHSNENGNVSIKLENGYIIEEIHLPKYNKGDSLIINSDTNTEGNISINKIIFYDNFYLIPESDFVLLILEMLIENNQYKFINDNFKMEIALDFFDSYEQIVEIDEDDNILYIKGEIGTVRKCVLDNTSKNYKTLKLEFTKTKSNEYSVKLINLVNLNINDKFYLLNDEETNKFWENKAYVIDYEELKAATSGCKILYNNDKNIPYGFDFFEKLNTSIQNIVSKYNVLDNKRLHITFLNKFLEPTLNANNVFYKDYRKNEEYFIGYLNFGSISEFNQYDITVEQNWFINFYYEKNQLYYNVILEKNKNAYDSKKRSIDCNFIISDLYDSAEILRYEN